MRVGLPWWSRISSPSGTNSALDATVSLAVLPVIVSSRTRSTPTEKAHSLKAKAAAVAAPRCRPCGNSVRMLGKDGVSARYRQQLTEVVERWRNPYSHGGFEKGHTATLWLHAPGVGALPVGMTNVRNSPHFSFMPASETDIAEVFALFDELDAWLKSELHGAFQWIESGLDVRFDENFRAMAAEAKKLNDFGSFLDYHAYQQSMHDNMDY
jgi:hypothetical protein